jgi:hypothetical protein
MDKNSTEDQSDLISHHHLTDQVATVVVVEALVAVVASAETVAVVALVDVVALVVVVVWVVTVAVVASVDEVALVVVAVLEVEMIPLEQLTRDSLYQLRIRVKSSERLDNLQSRVSDPLCWLAQ